MPHAVMYVGSNNGLLPSCVADRRSMLHFVDAVCFLVLLARQGFKWDTAAPAALLGAVGGQLTDMNGAVLVYHAGERTTITFATVTSCLQRGS